MSGSSIYWVVVASGRRQTPKNGTLCPLNNWKTQSPSLLMTASFGKIGYAYRLSGQKMAMSLHNGESLWLAISMVTGFKH
jgi:hypothetical protein